MAARRLAEAHRRAALRAWRCLEGTRDEALKLGALVGRAHRGSRGTQWKAAIDQLSSGLAAQTSRLPRYVAVLDCSLCIAYLTNGWLMGRWLMDSVTHN